MKTIKGIELLGSNLASIARAYGAVEVRHEGGPRYIAIHEDARTLRMLADEGDGAIEPEEGFDEAWERSKEEVTP